MLLTAYDPHAELVTQATRVEKPRFPVIDAHNHLGDEFGGGWERNSVAQLLDEMDASGVQILVDQDGYLGERLVRPHLEHFKAAMPDRLAVFGGIDWSRWAEFGDGFGEWAAGRLRKQVEWGAQGLKVWKNLGLHVTDQNGTLARVSDARLDPIWQTAAELNVPVTIHIADPAAFFRPLDEKNERWEELHEHPDWQFLSPPFPSFLSIVEDMARVVERHRQTTFIGAHMGCYAENLGWVGALLERCPNFNIDISARIAELGRQPYSSRNFFIKYADRILFGTDLPIRREDYWLHYRFLETYDEYFPYSLGTVPPQGRWNIYGLGLPDEVLQKVYSSNAQRIIFHTQSKI